MRTSCNGCRVLRRGCADDCSIRPCLEWIKTPESQAHATIFLAKFYGRAGLINLISTGPHQHRPAIFRSLLYESCGRIVDPIHGATGLMLSGRWKLCQAAVEAVLQGAPVAPNPSSTAGYNLATPIKVYDIRHVIKAPDDEDGPSVHLHKVSKGRGRFKRSAPAAKPLPFFSSSLIDLEENGSGFSLESAEGSHVSQAEGNGGVDEGEVGLDLTLGFNPVGGGACGSKSGAAARPDAVATAEMASVHPSRLELGLGLSA